MIRLTDKKLPAGLHQDVSQEMIHFVQAWPPLGRCGRIQRFLQSWAGAGARGITFPVPLAREMQHLKPKKSHCPETGDRASGGVGITAAALCTGWLANAVDGFGKSAVVPRLME